MTLLQQLSLLAVVSYFIGAIPFGLMVGLSRGIDPRQAGSGNIGATNVGRLLGGRFFAIVFLLDMLKSLIPMLLAGILVHSAGQYTWQVHLAWLLVGFAAVLGHMFSIFLKFKGGKGVATSAGLVLGLYPYYTLPALLGIFIFIIVFYFWRYVSLASIVAAGSFPVLYLALGFLDRRSRMFENELPLLIFAILVAGLIIFRHRTNISRLLAGTENRFKKGA